MWYIKRPPGGHYVTNFKKENVGIYIQALELYDRNNLEIRFHPNPDTQANPEEFFSLFCKDQFADLTEFWQVFRNLESLIK